MAYSKQTWSSNELITAAKLNHIEDGIAGAVNPDIVNNLTETTTGKVLDATQGKALKDMVEGLSAEDVNAIKDNYSYDTAAYPYTGQELILLHNVTTGENTVTDVASFLSSAGGGSGTNQGALVHYTKIISVSAGSTAQTFQDDNITADMVVLQAVITNPAAQGSDWTFTTSNGSVVLNGTVAEATTVTLYFGVSLSAAPSIQVNLASTAADNILKTNPTPGVMGTLGINNGGTGATSQAVARANLKVPYNARAEFVSSFSQVPEEAGFYMVQYTGTDSEAPVTSSGTYWWNIIQLGTGTRRLQIVNCAFSKPARNQVFIRVKHDSTWYGWYKFEGTQV